MTKKVLFIGILVVLGALTYTSYVKPSEQRKSLADLQGPQKVLAGASAEVAAAPSSETGAEIPAIGVVTRAGLSLIATGDFNPSAEGSDERRRGSGGVSIIDYNGDQSVVLEDDFQVTSGPDHVVYLTRGDVPQTRDAFRERRSLYTRLGHMSRFSGYQTFAIPANAATSDVSGVVIWCEQRGEFITAASLR